MISREISVLRGLRTSTGFQFFEMEFAVYTFSRQFQAVRRGVRLLDTQLWIAEASSEDGERHACQDSPLCWEWIDGDSDQPPQKAPNNSQ